MGRHRATCGNFQMWWDVRDWQREDQYLFHFVFFFSFLRKRRHECPTAMSIGQVDTKRNQQNGHRCTFYCISSPSNLSQTIRRLCIGDEGFILLMHQSWLLTPTKSLFAGSWTLGVPYLCSIHNRISGGDFQCMSYPTTLPPRLCFSTASILTSSNIVKMPKREMLLSISTKHRPLENKVHIYKILTDDIKGL